MSVEVETFNVKCTMEKRWVPYFISFLKMMEYDGIVGHSGSVAMYADGDGDFHPKFTPDIKYYITNPSIGEASKRPPEFLYDAG